MSFNRLRYDDCNYRNDSNENRSILNYIIDPRKYDNPNKCRNEVGLVGGNEVSTVRGNIIDTESELRGITRNLSKCATSSVKPLDNSYIILNDKTMPIDTRKLHLQSCQMIDYHNQSIVQRTV